jgi:uncharacterized membrane protein HdeD (DUF308 family)
MEPQVRGIAPIELRGQPTPTPGDPMYIGLGIFLLVVGAILFFAVGSTVVAGINLSVIGIILMIGGVLAIILSFLMQAGRRRDTGFTTTRESHVDPATGTRVDRTDVDPHA